MVSFLINSKHFVFQVFKSAKPGCKLYLQKIEKLNKINNNLLRAIGVSHISLENIFRICELNGFSCKLTGAGGGG